MHILKWFAWIYSGEQVLSTGYSVRKVLSGNRRLDRQVRVASLLDLQLEQSGSLLGKDYPLAEGLFVPDKQNVVSTDTTNQAEKFL